MKRIGLYIGVLILVIGTLSGCAKKEEKVLQIGSMPTLSAAIYAVGVDKGFFEEAGVEVELTLFRSAIERDAAATSGNLDGFMTDMMGAINLYQKGFPFVMTSAEYEDFGLMAMPESVDGIDNGSGKIGISENTIIEFIMDTYVAGDHEKVNVLAVPDRLAAVLSGEVDMGIFPQPFIGIIMGQGGAQVVSTAVEGLQPVVVVFDSEIIDQDLASVEAFYEGYEKALAYMKESDFDVYKEVLVNHGLATEETVNMLKLPLDHYGLRGPSEADFDLISQWMSEKNILDEVIDFQEITTQEFVTK